jgi:hypothetical protein
MGKDTDGTNWITIRYSVDVHVMADDIDDAFYHANLIVDKYTFGDFYAEIVEEE